VWRWLFDKKPMSKGRINYSLMSMVYVELILIWKVDWTIFPTMSQFPLQLQGSKKDILDFFDPLVEPKETSKTKKILKNITMRTIKVSEGTSGVIQSGPSSTMSSRKVLNASLGSIEVEVFSTPPTSLISTPNVTIAIEQSNALSKDNLLNNGGTSSSTREEVAMEKVARANAIIDILIDNNALDSFIYVAPNNDLPTTLNPMLSPRTEACLPHTSEVQLDDMSINCTLDGDEMEKKYPCLSTLSKAEQ